MSYLFIYYFLLPKTYCYPGHNEVEHSNYLKIICTTLTYFSATSSDHLFAFYQNISQNSPTETSFTNLLSLAADFFFPFQNVQHVLHTFSAIASELQRISTFSVLNLHGDGLSFSSTLHFLIHSLFLFPSTRPSLAAYFTCLLLNNSALNIYLSNLFSILSCRGAADS